MKKLHILDLFAGAGGERRRPLIEQRGHELVTLDYDPAFNCTITADIMQMTPAKLGRFDLIWASPPCECFSVASIGTHWHQADRSPKTAAAKVALDIISHTVWLLREMSPRCGWLIENPRGMMRTLPVMSSLPRVTVTYCQYGERNMKPTDLWGHVKGWVPRQPCRNGMPCHEAAPRGARTGTQGIKGSAERAVVPWALWDSVLTAAEGQ